MATMDRDLDALERALQAVKTRSANALLNEQSYLARIAQLEEVNRSLQAQLTAQGAAPVADASAAARADSSDSRSNRAAAFAAARRIRRSFSRAFFTSHWSISMPNMVVDPNETAMDSDTSPSLHPTSTHLLPWNHSRFKCAMRWSSSDSPTR